MLFIFVMFAWQYFDVARIKILSILRGNRCDCLFKYSSYSILFVVVAVFFFKSEKGRLLLRRGSFNNSKLLLCAGQK